MAANFWESTQHQHWRLSREELNRTASDGTEQERALVERFPLPEGRLLNIYLQHQIIKLGKRLHLRQQVLATAQVFLRRFYVKVEIRRTNPYLLLATACYLACKIEECPQHIRNVVVEARNLWPDLMHAETSRLGECEFALIAELNSQLILHHPYRNLTALSRELSLTPTELSAAWSVVNDHYLTDLPFLYAPSTIAAAAVVLGAVSQPELLQGLARTATATATGARAGGPRSKAEQMKHWLVQGSVDIEALAQCVQEMVSLYTLWETAYSEKECREQMARFIKAQSLER